MPCRLTEVKGHASAAGLKSGDRLFSVNGKNVEHLPHDKVVELITSVSDGVLQLNVQSGQETYCSSTSDGEVDNVEYQQIQHSRFSHNRYECSEDSGDSSTSSSTTTSASSVVEEYISRKSCRHRSTRATLQSMPNNSGHQRTSQPKRQSRHQTVLRPSQTYEQPKQAPTRRQHRRPHASSSHRHTLKEYKRNLSSFDGGISNGTLHISDSEMHSQFNSQTARLQHTTASGTMAHFKSIDNLLLPTDDDELLLHQHYRNRLKCSVKNSKLSADNRLNDQCAGGGSGIESNIQLPVTVTSIEEHQKCLERRLKHKLINDNDRCIQVDGTVETSSSGAGGGNVQACGDLATSNIDHNRFSSTTSAIHSDRIYDIVTDDKTLYQNRIDSQHTANNFVDDDDDDDVENGDTKLIFSEIPNNNQGKFSRKTNSTTSGISSISSSNSTSPASTAVRNTDRSLDPNGMQLPVPKARTRKNRSKVC